MASPLSNDGALMTETEVCSRLGVSVEQLHRILDEKIFNTGEPRPAECLFRNSDLVLLSFWLRYSPLLKEHADSPPSRERRTLADRTSANILEMPRRS